MSFRTKMTALAITATLTPWLFVLLLLAERPLDAFVGLAAAAALASALAIARFSVRLRPLEAAALALRNPGDAKAPPASAGQWARDEIDTIVSGIADLQDRLSALQHRWSQRHPLTDLPTRELLLVEMQRDIEEGAQETMLGIIRLRDFDRLSAFDPAMADVVLKTFASMLAAAVSSTRPLAQVDRDSFAIWFRGTQPGNAETELRALCYALSKEMDVGDSPLVPEVQASVGLFPTDGSDPVGLVTRTLLTLGKEERGATGNVQFLSAKPAHAAREHFSLEQDLRHAIAREQLELHFQPVVDIAQGRLTGAEALIRWHHPEMGMVPPGRFIPILEDTQLIEEIGNWTLNAACRAAGNWRTRGLDGLTIAVNLSAMQLKDPKLVQIVNRTLDRHRLQPTSLELELTETAATEDAERTFRLFTQLRAMGISLAIDDFGSGYSSLSYVKNLPFDKLKIDREFIDEVDRRRDSQAICRTLVELARGLGIRVLAEGVEREEEVVWLQQIGCTLFQGFYFSEPVTEQQFVQQAADPSWQRGLTRPPLSNSFTDRMTA